MLKSILIFRILFLMIPINISQALLRAYIIPNHLNISIHYQQPVSQLGLIIHSMESPHDLAMPHHNPNIPHAPEDFIGEGQGVEEVFPIPIIYIAVGVCLTIGIVAYFIYNKLKKGPKDPQSGTGSSIESSKPKKDSSSSHHLSVIYQMSLTFFLVSFLVYKLFFFKHCLMHGISFDYDQIAFIVPVFFARPTAFKTLTIFFLVAVYVLCLLKVPLILLLIMILLSIMPFLRWIPLSWGISKYTKVFLDTFVKLLILSGSYKLLVRYYIILNETLTLKGFKLWAILLHTSFLCYLTTSRTIFYLKLELMEIPLNLYLIYLICTLMLIVRGLTSFTLFVLPSIMLNYDQDKTILAIGPEMPSDIPEAPLATPRQREMPKIFGGLFNRHTHNHIYPSNPPEIPRAFFYRNFGYGVAVIGIGLSTFACVQYSRSANAAVISAYEAKRAADIAAKQAGLISEDVYYERHPRDRPLKK